MCYVSWLHNAKCNAKVLVWLYSDINGYSILLQVDSLQAKLLEKLEQFLVNLQLESRETSKSLMGSEQPSEQGNSAHDTVHEVR